MSAIPMKHSLQILGALFFLGILCSCKKEELEKFGAEVAKNKNEQIETKIKLTLKFQTASPRHYWHESFTKVALDAFER